MNNRLLKTLYMYLRRVLVSLAWIYIFLNLAGSVFSAASLIMGKTCQRYLFIDVFELLFYFGISIFICFSLKEEHRVPDDEFKYVVRRISIAAFANIYWQICIGVMYSFNQDFRMFCLGKIAYSILIGTYGCFVVIICFIMRRYHIESEALSIYSMP